MTPKPEIFHYATELDAMHGKVPIFDDAQPFRYDPFENGTPTTVKLARIAAQVEHENADNETLSRWSAGTPIRFYFWNNDGSVYHGSIEVALDWDPVIVPVASSVRSVEDAAA